MNKEGRLVNRGEKLPLSNLYSHGLEANYILTDSIEKAYRRYCYSNLKKLVEKGLYTELVKPEKVIQCVRKDENVNIIN